MKKLLKKTEGFTLVELIVVIAILGILAGVGTVGYSGYIKKANEAADELLLSSLNTAFAAACVENGVSTTQLTGTPVLEWTDQRVTGVTMYKEAFLDYYDEDAEFKVYTNLSYNRLLGKFEVLAGGMVEVAYKGGTLRLSESDMEAFVNSGLGDLGVVYLLGEMDNVVSYASDYEGLLDKVRTEGDFKDICKMFNANYDGSAAYKDLEMQALVLYTAEQYKNLNADELYNTIVNKPGAYITNYDKDGDDFAANAAMYSLVLVYANSDEGKAIMQEKGWSASNPDHIRDLMLNEASETDRYGRPVSGTEYNTFGKWLSENESAAKSNLAGFGGAMGMLSGNKGNLDMGTILTKGYGDTTSEDSLANALDGAMS